MVDHLESGYLIIWQAFTGVVVHFQRGACLQTADVSIYDRQSLCPVLAGPLGASDKELSKEYCTPGFPQSTLLPWPH